MTQLADQGIENFVFSEKKAIHSAMLSDRDAAFEQLLKAAENGWATRGDLIEVMPQFEVFAEDPRIEEIEAIMLGTVNRDRAMVGLPPFDANYQVAP
jgi:hypothetical protein